MHIKTTIELWKEGDLYVACSPELDMVAQGTTFEEARRNMAEVIEIQLEEMQRMGTLDEFLREAGFVVRDNTLAVRRGGSDA